VSSRARASLSRSRRGGEQRVRSFSPEPVRFRKAAIEVLEVAAAGERGRLMDDPIGSGGGNGVPHGALFEQVEHDRFRALGAEGARSFG
jgi:hypothetical protein